jgi:hypothetical protein
VQWNSFEKELWPDEIGRILQNVLRTIFMQETTGLDFKKTGSYFKYLRTYFSPTIVVS